MKTTQPEMQRRLQKVIKGVAEYGAEKAILFGSSARGDTDRFSDIDLIVVKQTERRFLDRLAEVIEFVQPDFAFDVLVYTPEEFARMLEEENPFLTYALRDGKVIYERPEG